jgi:hypothetical protein
VLNRSFVRDKSSSLTLDFGAPVLKSELSLSLSGDNFRRRVAVEGRNKHEAAWETLTDGAYVFAVPAPWAARYETVPLPENNFQFLRVTEFDGPDDTEPVDIREAGLMLVLRTLPGSAHAIAAALDRTRWPEVIGSIAGDDTVFVAFSDRVSLQRIRGRLAGLRK